MRVRQLSPSGDMTFGSSQNNFLVDSPAAVAQVVMTTLGLWQGEWYLDTTAGTPYLEGVIGLHSQTEADMTIQSQIQGIEVIISSNNVPAGATPGQLVPAVTSIINYESTRENKNYSATCTLNTIYGPTPLQISNYAIF